MWIMRLSTILQSLISSSSWASVSIDSSFVFVYLCVRTADRGIESGVGTVDTLFDDSAMVRKSAHRQRRDKVWTRRTKSQRLLMTGLRHLRPLSPRESEGSGSASLRSQYTSRTRWTPTCVVTGRPPTTAPGPQTMVGHPSRPPCHPLCRLGRHHHRHRARTARDRHRPLRQARARRPPIRRERRICGATMLLL